MFQNFKSMAETNTNSLTPMKRHMMRRRARKRKMDASIISVALMIGLFGSDQELPSTDVNNEVGFPTDLPQNHPCSQWAQSSSAYPVITGPSSSTKGNAYLEKMLQDESADDDDMQVGFPSRRTNSCGFSETGSSYVGASSPSSSQSSDNNILGSDFNVVDPLEDESGLWDWLKEEEALDPDNDLIQSLFEEHIMEETTDSGPQVKLEPRDEPVQDFAYPAHNHTYSNGLLLPHVSNPIQPSTAALASDKTAKDDRFLLEYQVPFTRETLVDASLRDFYEFLNDPSLTETQKSLMKAVRRRGKNKIAARNCRQRNRDAVQKMKNNLDILLEKQHEAYQRRMALKKHVMVAEEHFHTLKGAVLHVVNNRPQQTFQDGRYDVVERVDGDFVLEQMSNEPAKKVDTSAKPQSTSSEVIYVGA